MGVLLRLMLSQTLIPGLSSVESPLGTSLRLVSSRGGVPDDAGDEGRAGGACDETLVPAAAAAERR